MMKSLYSGVAGMKVHNQRMDVIGNNVSNVNTTGYKASNVTFKDIYYQTKANASSGDNAVGGRNPTQIGYGAQLGTITQVMTQSGFTFTDSEYDCALQGDGYFQVMDTAGNIFYTRAGVFSVDSYGNLTDPNGNIVLGVMGDPSNVTTGQSQRITLNVPPVDNNYASCDKTVNGYDVSITASAYGEEGNISFTIVDSDTPYATKSGKNLTIYLDLDQDFGADRYVGIYDDEGNVSEDITDAELRNRFNLAVQDFQDAINDAIIQGGVGLEDGVLPLNIEFGSMPPVDEVLAKTATNTVYMLVDVTEEGAETSSYQALGLNFTAQVPGAYANKYEIDLKTANQGYVSAKWKDDVLTITLPPTFDGIDGEPIELIQAAIDEAAGGNAERMLTVALDYKEYPEEEDGRAIENAEIGTFNFDLGVVNTQRLGLDGGKDNFFSEMAVALSTVAMTGGRVASEQFVDDLETLQIDSDGVIYGRHSVHGVLRLGRIDVVTFENPMGLDQVGTSMWRESLASGPAQVKIAGTEGAGEIRSGAREMSNVDLAQEFSDMIITQRGYQANSRIITVSDTMLEELVNLKR